MSHGRRHYVDLPDEAATVQAGLRLARQLRPGDVLALVGELGAGKTTLTKGIVAGLGLGEPGVVTSPTFVLVNEYPACYQVYHVDAYRLAGPAELEDLGFDEMCQAGGVVIVEWADRVADAIAPSAVWIELAPIVGGRRLTIRPGGPRSTAMAGGLVLE